MNDAVANLREAIEALAQEFVSDAEYWRVCRNAREMAKETSPPISLVAHTIADVFASLASKIASEADPALEAQGYFLPIAPELENALRFLEGKEPQESAPAIIEALYDAKFHPSTKH